MGIIKYFRKKYWEAAIFRGGRRIPFTCDGLTAVPDSAYALFTEKELEKIYEERDIFHAQISCHSPFQEPLLPSADKFPSSLPPHRF